MKLLSFSTCILFFFISFDCLAQRSYTGKENKIEIRQTDSVSLKENQVLLGRISSFSVDENRNFYVLNSQSGNIVKYSANGEQLEVFGEKGRGPFEFLNPSKISIRKDTLSIWDQKLLRFTVLTVNGKELLQFGKFNYAKDYIKKYNNYIVSYNSGGIQGPLITIHDLSNKEIIKDFGSKNNAHILLMSLSGSGALNIDRGSFLYATANHPVIHKVNFDDFSEEKIKVEIPDFKTEKIEQSPNEIINNNRRELVSYLAENSRIVNIFSLENYYVLEAQTGELKQKTPNPFSSRSTTFVILNRQFEQIDTITFQNSNFIASNLKAEGNGNKIYLIYREKGGTKSNYIKSVWQIEPTK